ncbi:MAG TPA: hypothetical protein VFG19_17530 [Geobacteraceae bacterium]|nr:hypothetical protein [Geobacteraceae bacterium]
MSEMIDTARAYHDKALFESRDQRDASYLTNCMKLIIESCLLVGFIEYVSSRKHASFLSYPYDKLVGNFNEILGKYAGDAFKAVIRSM